jgi:hypothetical protein
MRCGNCTGAHDTVDEVRACHGTPKAEAVERVARKFVESGLHPVDEGPQWPASDKQINYVLGLQRNKLLPEWWTAMDEAQLRKLERDEVSGIITMLKGFQENKATDSSKADYRNVPAGRYALYTVEHHAERDENGRTVNADISTGATYGTWKFYRVTDGKGKWKGYKFIKRLIGAPGDYQESQLPREERMAIMKRLEADPKQAMVDYGKQTMHCGRCSSPLTHERSRAAGYGEKCAGILGWPW